MQRSYKQQHETLITLVMLTKLAELQRSEDIHKNVVTELKCSGTSGRMYYESTLQKYFFKKSIFT